MTIQEKLVQAYDLAEYGIKTKLKELKGTSHVKYVVSECRKGLYTKDDVIDEMMKLIVDLAKNTRDDAIDMCNQIERI